MTRRNKECIKHLVGGTHKRKTCAHVSDTERKGERKPISVTKILSKNIMSLICYYVEQYKKCELYMSDLIRKDDGRPKKQEIINKMKDAMTCKNIHNEGARRAEL